MLKDASIWVVLPMADVAATKKFYEAELGLSVMPGATDDMLMYQCGDGTGIVLYQHGPTKGDHTEAGWNVTDLAAEMADLRSRGVTFEEYDLPNLKTENGVATMGPIKSAWVKDPNGNILALNQMGA